LDDDDRSLFAGVPAARGCGPDPRRASLFVTEGVDERLIIGLLVARRNGERLIMGLLRELG
jgi:hypothetical protein